MKKLLLSSLLLIITFMYFVPQYNELNNLSIIDSIGIEKKNDNYNIYLREVIPTKVDNGLKYEYKTYTVKTTKLNNTIKIFEKKNKKKLYLNKVKLLVTNTTSDKIIKSLNIKPKVIYHSKNVKSKITTH